jgi:hypothetical protein
MRTLVRYYGSDSKVSPAARPALDSRRWSLRRMGKGAILSWTVGITGREVCKVYGRLEEAFATASNWTPEAFLGQVAMSPSLGVRIVTISETGTNRNRRRRSPGSSTRSPARPSGLRDRRDGEGGGIQGVG